LQQRSGIRKRRNPAVGIIGRRQTSPRQVEKVVMDRFRSQENWQARDLITQGDVKQFPQKLEKIWLDSFPMGNNTGTNVERQPFSRQTNQDQHRTVLHAKN